MAQSVTKMPASSPPLEVKYTQLLIDGKFVDSVSGKTFPTVDPRNGEVIANIAEAGSEDVDIAVQAARKAFNKGPWPRMSGHKRSGILLKWAELLEKHSDELAALETWDGGKPLMVSKHMDLPTSIKYLRSIAGWGDKISGNTFRLDGPYHAFTLYEPIGVVGAVIPWNFPLFMFMLKTAPALVAGNTMVLKPAEQTPLTALFAAALAIEAGVPPGVLNIVPGFGAIAGAAISSHMDIDKVTFTGSTAVGRQIMEAAARSNLKAVTLELGGKSPVVICDDADVDLAVDLAHLSLFFNMGQCCVAGSRVFVQEGIYEKFLNKVTEKTTKQVVGDPFKTDVQQGPQINESQLKRILSYIESGKEEGAKLLTGGNRIGDKGYFVEPTIFADVKDDMKIAKEEIFGPVMSVLKFKTLEEVIERANHTCYGLAAGIVTKDLNVANRLSRSIRAGTVWINCYHVVDPVMPFGGYKMSGIGRESGLHGILHYVQAKAVVTPVEESPWL